MTEVLFASPKPYTVNICTAELCKCQEDGVGAEDILQDLLSRDLPYPIDEAPCLGACGKTLLLLTSKFAPQYS